MINRVHLCGNMGSDIEVKETRDGGKWGKFSLATNKKIKGEDKVTWHNCVVFDEKKVEYLQNYAGTGTLLYVEGEISNRSYEQDGVKKWMSEVVIGRFDSRVQILNSRGGGGEARDPQAPKPEKPGDNVDDMDDEIPFITSAGWR